MSTPKNVARILLGVCATALCLAISGCSSQEEKPPATAGGGAYYNGHMAADDVSAKHKPKGVKTGD